MSSGSAWVWVSSTTSRLAVSPPRTGSRGRTTWPSSSALPDLIHSVRRERENSGNSSASAASKRRPAALAGTMAVRGVSEESGGSGSVMRKNVQEGHAAGPYWPIVHGEGGA